MSYSVGDLIQISATWTNAVGTATDPTAVFAQYRNPSGDLTALTYGVDVALVRDSAGAYHVDIDANEAGTWRYRFYSTGTGQASSDVRSLVVFASTV